ncbi:penicillin-binding protein 1A [Breznakiella homolactica]|uniref:peptidoglycan glycosyltransferase n=1 Tax=Breznakiella homolactica TaxID=2798577 RepID=A0A7T7XR50_9SPIR|nr:PBP1A family penicillin-binding protein [Breznakiella homolactica]QQO10966.1 PBP1A family penicillin-binding protein [Breznakiella homolactica]
MAFHAGRSNGKGTIVVRIVAALTIIIAVIIGIGLGLSLAETVNIKNQENFVEFAPALPTKIVDANGIIITEFSAEEKRELVSLSELPKHLIYAVLSREDPDFYNHKGFSIRGIARAAFGKLTGRNLGGGSTITQQVAGTLYTDRTEYTISRKIKELWWAIQMERRYTKNEILEIYLNYMIMGPGTYGVEAASKYFFGHSAREITLAEAAILVVQLSSPSRYNPLDNPNTAMSRQLSVLDRMIEFGYTTPEEAEASFNEYWDNYDYTRVSTSAYYSRDDLAPWFSEYVRRELGQIMYGTMDYYRDGYTVITTLDLQHQQAAAKYMEQGLRRANEEYSKSQGTRLDHAEQVYIPIIDLLSLCFDLDGIHATSDAQNEQKAYSRYNKVINPVVDMAALVFGIQDLKVITNSAFGELKTAAEKNTVEGALIAIENETGYIKALIGGSRFDESNQYIRATQGRLMPGSAFKPLYYSAAIDTREFTAATLIYDLPVVFYNEDGTPYIPLNFRGEWKGPVLLYEALAQSMNVASVKILDEIGFDAAIDRAGDLLGITDPDAKRRTFPRVYPLGLGIISVSPLQMARAFAIFANQGREVTPIAIRTVEDRNGKVILDPERELRVQQRRLGNEIQVISPQNAYIMTTMLEKTVETGTLAHGAGWGSKFTFRDENGKRFRMPAAGKTGTTQNWSDAWAVGFTPYYTAALWFGFDKPGNSLGVSLTGSTLVGPIWGDFMREIHMGLPEKQFVRPTTGIIDVTVCRKSGLLKSPACNSGDITLPFLEGTQPTRYCDVHQDQINVGGSSSTLAPLYIDTMVIDQEALLGEITMPHLDLSSLPAAPRSSETDSRSSQGRTTTGSTRQPAQSPYYGIELPDYNPLLD